MLANFNSIVWLVFAAAVVASFAALAVWLVREEIKYIKRRAEQRKEDNYWEKERDKVSEGEVMEEWEDIIEDASRHKDEFMDRMAAFLSGTSLPRTTVFKRNLSLGGTKPLQFLVAVNAKVKGYRILIGAEEYGEHLNVSWRFARDLAEQTLIELSEAREREGVLHDKRFLWEQRKVQDGVVVSDGWTTPRQVNMLDQKEMSNWAGMIRARVQAEAKRLKHGTRKENGTPTGSGGFIDIS